MRERVLDKILALMQDGKPRTLRRIHYLTNVSLNTVRKALVDGHLVKVGEEPRPVPYARCGQAIVTIAPKGDTCTPPGEASVPSLKRRAVGT